MINKKVRRHSGRRRGRIVYGFNKRYLIEQGLEPLEYWDDWSDYRDGLRGSGDRKLLRSPFMVLGERFNVNRWNNKLMRLIQRRYARKMKMKYLREMASLTDLNSINFVQNYL